MVNMVVEVDSLGHLVSIVLMTFFGVDHQEGVRLGPVKGTSTLKSEKK